MQKSVESFLEDPASADLLNQLIKKYGNMVIKRISNVTMETDSSLSIENVEADYTKLTVTVNEMEALNIARALLTSAENDTDLIGLCTRFGVCTKEEYTAAIEKERTDISEKITALEKSKSDGGNVLTMYLWVNGQGGIAGRSFLIKSEGETLDIGYRTAKSGIKMGVEAWINSNGQDMLRGSGSLSAGLLGASGNFKITYPGFAQNSTGEVNIDFKNVKYAKKDAKGYINGEITVSGSDFEGMSFHINCTGTPEQQDMLFDLLKDKTSLASISASVKEIPYTDFELPSSNDKIYSMAKENQLEEYMKSADIKGYLEGIKKKTHVSSINSLIDGFLGNSAANAE